MITQYDKAGVGAIAALVTGLFANWFEMPEEASLAISTILTGFFVWLVPNSTKKDSLI